jgi:hypothetical protein
LQLGLQLYVRKRTYCWWGPKREHIVRRNLCDNRAR